jgi:hypothetical protein
VRNAAVYQAPRLPGPSRRVGEDTVWLCSNSRITVTGDTVLREITTGEYRGSKFIGSNVVDMGESIVWEDSPNYVYTLHTGTGIYEVYLRQFNLTQPSLCERLQP